LTFLDVLALILNALAHLASWRPRCKCCGGSDKGQEPENESEFVIENDDEDGDGDGISSDDRLLNRRYTAERYRDTDEDN